MKEQLDFRVSPKTAFNEDEFAKFYLIAFTMLMGYLLYKATQKKR